MQHNTNSTASATSNSVPVKELYELIIFWMTHRFNSEHYVLDLLSRMEMEGIQLPCGLVKAVNDGEFESKSAVEIIKRLLAHL